MSETYESIRDSELLTQDTRESFIRADQARRGLRREYEKLIKDPSLNDEYRARRAQELFEQRKESVEAQGRRAREALLKQAKFAEQAAIPRPSGEPLSSSDPTKLLLDQNEASRVIRTVERKQAQPGPFKPDVGAYLTEEYKRGLEIGGVEGGAICRGTLRAAGELGISTEDLLRPLRGDRDRDSLDRARRLYLYADMISTKAPEVPRKLDARKPKRVPGSYRSAPSALVPQTDGPPVMASTDSGGAKKTRRKKTWK